MSNGILNEENEPLIDQIPVPVKMIKLNAWNEVCSEKELTNLMTILTDSNKTLDEITREYAEHYEDKSKTSIHRYLKLYIEKGYIIESGRIIKGKRHTAEKMYTNSAKIFFIDNQYLDAWEQEERSKTLALKIGAVAQRKFNYKGFDFEELKILLKEFENFIEKSAVHTLEKVHKDHPEIAHEIFALDNDEKLVFFTVLKNSFFYLTKGKVKDFKKRLDEIFTKKPINIDELIKESLNADQQYEELKIDKPDGYQTSFTRKMVHFTDYKNYTKYILDINYSSLLNIFSLNDFPLSIKAITDKFPAAYEIEYKYFKSKSSDKNYPEIFKKKMNLSKDANKSLSENRIYRLIQDLKNDGMVIEAGRQISKDTSKTSILYTTTGKRIIYLENRDEFWKHENKWKRVIALIAKIFKFYYETKNLNENSFYDLLTRIEKLKFDSFKEMLADIQNKDIANFFHYSLNGIELNSSISSLGNINVFFQHEDIFDLTEKLQNAFLEI